MIRKKMGVSAALTAATAITGIPGIDITGISAHIKKAKVKIPNKEIQEKAEAKRARRREKLLKLSS